MLKTKEITLQKKYNKEKRMPRKQTSFKSKIELNLS